MKSKIKYSDEKISKVKAVKDFLPKPEKLVFKESRTGKSGNTVATKSKLRSLK